MVNQIDPTAYIGPNVVMGAGNAIGPYCVLDGSIVLGDHNILHHHVSLTNQVHVGNENTFFPFCAFGGRAEMGAKGDREPTAPVSIGNHNVFRESVIVHAPFYYDATAIGNHCYLMNQVYLAHDVRLGNHVVISGGARFGGRAFVGSGATIGMGASIHQRCGIGDGAMIGMQCAVIRDILPFAKVAGVPAHILDFNHRGASRMGMDEHAVEAAAELFERFRRGDQVDAVSEPFKSFIERFPDYLRG